MTTPIDQLILPLTEDQVLERFLVNLETLGLAPRLWRSGGIARSILRVVAASYASSTVVHAAFIRSGFLELAEGVWLTRLAKSVYGVDRRPATFAVGKATFTNGGGGIFNYGPDEVRMKWIGGNKIYTITQALALPALGTATVTVRAVEAGSASSAPAGAINSLETTLLLVTVTNAEPVYGSDEETDAELRKRCLDKLGTLSLRGPRGAYRYAITSAKRPDGSPVDINRQSISPDSSTGLVTIICAAPSGPPLATDLVYVRDSIELYARPDSVTVTVVGAQALAIARTLDVWATRTEGVSADDLKALVLKALEPVTLSYPIGGHRKPPALQGYLWEDYVSGLVKGAHLSIYDVDGFGADVTLNPDQVVTLNATIVVRIVEGNS